MATETRHNATQRGTARRPRHTAPYEVRPVNGLVLFIVHTALRLYFFLCGVRVKTVNRVGTPEKHAIVLCNHGSFIDFIFAAALLGKHKPHFIIARLYFYNNILRRLLRLLGGFPKSMFAMDTESAKNCLRVLKSDGILAMMPEARLSTIGRFEDIQPGTYSFIKKSAVPVYTIKIHGDYLADPKWGKGFRRGSVVEAELDILYTAEQVNSLSLAQLKQGIEQRLAYDEFEWLQQRPHLHYRSKRMAEGLENVLTLCPLCRKKYTLYTERHRVFCGHCGYLTAVDDRYCFDKDFPFVHPAEWYDWQMAQLHKEIAEDPHYALVSQVELHLPGNGRGLTRPAGEGVCTLDRHGLTYRGTKDGETVTLQFPLRTVYRLLFGAGKNFEIYNGREILFFIPTEKRSAVDWYMASMILYDRSFPSDS